MKKYMAQKPNFIQGHLDMLRSVADGVNAVTFDSTSSTTGALKRAGLPIAFAFPANDVMPAFFITAGIFRQAPHPNAAKLFLDWYMAKEQQSRLGTFSARTMSSRRPGSSRLRLTTSSPAISSSSATGPDWRPCARSSKATPGPTGAGCDEDARRQTDNDRVASRSPQQAIRQNRRTTRRVRKRTPAHASSRPRTNRRYSGAI